MEPRKRVVLSSRPAIVNEVSGLTAENIPFLRR